MGQGQSAEKKEYDRKYKEHKKFIDSKVGCTPTPVEVDCHKKFLAGWKRDQDSRYIVRLPLKNNEPMDSLKSGIFKTANYMLKSMDRKFQKDSKLQSDYCKFLKEYLDLGHMELSCEEEAKCFLSRFAALRNESSTTKLRVVFNGSCKVNSSGSLNDFLHIRSNLLCNLFDLVVRWRNYSHVFIANIEKMFRQIGVDVLKQVFQSILWRFDPSQDIRVYKLTTVTYGLACSPYLACRVIKLSANNYRDQYPKGASVLDSEIYMDDVLSGGHSANEAKVKLDELNCITELGKIPLRKWSSNSPDLFENLPTSFLSNRPVDLKDNKEIASVVGLIWDPHADNLLVITYYYRCLDAYGVVLVI
ncbi:uncharacterized protein LOC106641882 [Copidosoma floridanum]|uniref:uncharacterized protein LOC106641882 n=1 Tax=Copidosoma floridanum TaxID=29053 RepID=UPI0006C9903A|nr:uncharacterized protein LOC106641882 [Copidosoma floridanum]